MRSRTSLTDRTADSLVGLGVRSGERLGLAVSGGADSTALAHLAALAAPGLGVGVHVLHVDHALYAGSRAAARRVGTLAEGLGVPWTVLRAPVRRGRRASLEAEARRIRYFVLERAAAELGCLHVATAHTLDDQAETVLLRALRGTGTSGLAGIAPALGRVVRPLLGVERSELRAWLEQRGIAWTDDPSNADVGLERNWVRREVLPAMVSRRPGSVRALARLADLARDDVAALDEIASDRVSLARRPAPGWVELPSAALSPPTAFAKRAVMAILRELGGRLDAAAVETVLRVASHDGPRAAACGEGVVASRTRDGVALVSAVDPPPPVLLPARGVAELSAWGLRVRVDAPRESPPWGWRCLAPAGTLSLRARTPGDRVPTSRGTRKVQDVLVDAKVPRTARDRIPLLCVDGVPVAVVGLTSPGPLAAIAVAATRASGARHAASAGELVSVEAEPMAGVCEDRADWAHRTSSRRTRGRS